jgi:hypothetical protein
MLPECTMNIVGTSNLRWLVNEVKADHLIIAMATLVNAVTGRQSHHPRKKYAPHGGALVHQPKQ